jgi:hypothetical protein
VSVALSKTVVVKATHSKSVPKAKVSPRVGIPLKVMVTSVSYVFKAAAMVTSTGVECSKSAPGQKGQLPLCL